jgi:outer membrane protein TolC
MKTTFKWIARCCFTVFLTGALTSSRAQQPAPNPSGDPPPTVALSLKRAIELALQNSKDIQAAKIQGRLADRSAMISRAEFLPNLYMGSGLGYSNGIPETPGGRAPSIFNVTYTEQILNEPLRGQSKELQEQARSQLIVIRDVQSSVISRTAMAYLELAKVRHSLQLLAKEQESATRILQVTQERQTEGLELPVALTRAQLTRARISQRTIQLEGREDELEVFLRAQLGLQESQRIEVSPEDLPGEAEQEGANLVAMALESNTELQLAESDVRARQFRLTGEKRGYYPTVQLVSVYSVLGKFNNYEEFFNKFQRNNFNFGIDMRIPIFSARTRANVGLAQVNLDAAKAALSNKRTEVSADVRQKSRRVRESDATKEIARLELQLAQQDLSVLQSQLEEGKMNLRDVEKARLEESDKWLAFLDANFGRQQAQLELLKAAGQLDKVWQ